MIVSNSPSPASCPGTTTIEVNACFAARFVEANADLNRYYNMAIRRGRREGGAPVAKKLVQAERSWLSYRDTECGAAYEKYRGGTIRTSMETGCLIRITRLRTYIIWRNWLTYPDSTPSLLPRPAIDTALSDGRG